MFDFLSIRISDPVFNCRNCENSMLWLIWDKVFKNGSSKICGKQLLKNFTLSIYEHFVPYEYWIIY